MQSQDLYSIERLYSLAPPNMLPLKRSPGCPYTANLMGVDTREDLKRVEHFLLLFNQFWNLRTSCLTNGRKGSRGVTVKQPRAPAISLPHHHWCTCTMVHTTIGTTSTSTCTSSGSGSHQTSPLSHIQHILPMLNCGFHPAS